MRNTRVIALLCFVCVPVLGAWDCPGEEDGPVQIQNEPADPDPAVDPADCDPCADGEAVFGPEEFTRGHCQPQSQTRTFTMDLDEEACILVTNDGVSAAWIKIDGEKIFKPCDFNPHVTDLQKTVPLAAGEHELKVRVSSCPGSSLTIEIRACAEQPGPRMCSDVAVDWCEAKSWTVVADALDGNIVCTVDGRSAENNCDQCNEYNIVIWEDGSGDRYCPSINYSTYAGNIYCGHNPCECGDNLVWCGTWDMLGCEAD